MKHISFVIKFTLLLLLFPTFGFGAILFQENFEDTNFSSRGWYDGSTGTIDKNEHIPESTASLMFHFLKGGTKPTGGLYSFRHKFAASKSVYLSYWIKHSSNWIGSGTSYHPHVFLFVTNKNNDYAGLAYTFFTAYVEENQGYPLVGIQDGQNIDETKIGQNLIGITENRAVAGCNGIQANLSEYSSGCYPSGSVHWNGIQWRGAKPYFFDPVQKIDWHYVEAYFQLNDVFDGVGQPNGIVRYWYDGQMLIDHSNIIMRTAKNSTMQFNQFIIAPYIGNGSPSDQSFWIDNLTVGTSRPSGPATPSPPKNVKTQ